MGTYHCHVHWPGSFFGRDFDCECGAGPVASAGLSASVWRFEGDVLGEEFVGVSILMDLGMEGKANGYDRVVWHQQCRRICSAPGTWLVRDVLGLRKGTFASKYIQLYVGFLVSAIAHGGAAVLMSGEWVDDGSLAYFLGQATIIMVEDHVIDLGKRMGFKDSVAWRLVGSVWTVVAFGVSLMPYVGGQVDNAMWVHQATPDWFGLAPKFVL